ncbi:uncharacterized protein BO97DRAFT_429123 [Aspergillus homomorphus CBS 101889]|uniref:Uncharacterized protein n=1 Tax=Aspergillus homomorphus (strain CBS 101889) TaxID=1450537 RepID=A0A395HL76_ASPHC|nr:hypothetical protein BO97DRAFT_429123 [Aspergillus homomorphus CBS 101889]RAL07628.1 hypothetical protein BO97DRAFT_429123 [Aspergillus homomorphus CBS 101889]
MKTVTEPRDRYNLRKALTAMEWNVKALEKTNTLILNQSALKRLRVRALPRSLDADGSLAPKNFSSLALKDIPEPTEEYSYVGDMMVDFPEIPRMWPSHRIGDDIFGSTVIRIILGQLKLKVFVNDMVEPVLLFSLSRLHPHVIEAYFDGQELVLRHTKPYDFSFLNAAGFKTFAQWLLSDPFGDTSKRALQT